MNAYGARKRRYPMVHQRVKLKLVSGVNQDRRNGVKYKVRWEMCLNMEDWRSVGYMTIRRLYVSRGGPHRLDQLAAFLRWTP